jgi:hypothetical protein
MNSAQVISQIFSYSFIFLLGVIVGAWAELYFDKRQARKKENVKETAAPLAQETVSAPVPTQEISTSQEMPFSRESMDVPLDRIPRQEEVVEPALPPPPVIDRSTSRPSSAPEVVPSPQNKQPVPAIVVVEDGTKAARQLSIAEQIDEILEELQRFTTSSLPAVSLKDDGYQGVLVKVGNKMYPGIDAIPDQEVKDLIRKAVTEWERRSARK